MTLFPFLIMQQQQPKRWDHRRGGELAWLPALRSNNRRNNLWHCNHQPFLAVHYYFLSLHSSFLCLFSNAAYLQVKYYTRTKNVFRTAGNWVENPLLKKLFTAIRKKLFNSIDFFVFSLQKKFCAREPIYGDYFFTICLYGQKMMIERRRWLEEHSLICLVLICMMCAVGNSCVCKETWRNIKRVSYGERESFFCDLVREKWGRGNSVFVCVWIRLRRKRQRISQIMMKPPKCQLFMNPYCLEPWMAAVFMKCLFLFFSGLVFLKTRWFLYLSSSLTHNIIISTASFFIRSVSSFYSESKKRKTLMVLKSENVSHILVVSSFYTISA